MARGLVQSGNRRLARQSLPEALAESLRERILNGEFKEGEQIVQETIAAEYEVSRMPVREALRQLEATGLIELRTHKGAIVTSMPPDQISELFDLRALVECDVFARAIPCLSKDDLAASRTILAQLDQAYHSGDAARWGSLNWEFHRSLYAPAGRVQTLAQLQSINMQIDRYIRLQLALTDAFTVAEQEHHQLLGLASDHKVKEAVALLRTHILNAGRDLLLALKKKRLAEAA